MAFSATSKIPSPSWWYLPGMHQQEFGAGSDMEGCFQRTRGALGEIRCNESTTIHIGRRLLYDEHGTVAVTDDPLGSGADEQLLQALLAGLSNDDQICNLSPAR
jgi:hypothetical protein